MFTYAVIGASLAFTAAVQPGPTQAYMLSSAAAIGWRRTLPAALAPVISDGPIALVALLILGKLSTTLQGGLRVAGGVLLLYFAWRTLRQWRHGESTAVGDAGSAPRTLLEAVVVNLLNPHPYIGWSLILGPVVLAAWREAPSSGVTVVVAFYTSMVLTFGVLIWSFGSARHLGHRFQRGLLLVSGALLAVLGAYQLSLGVWGILL